MKQRKQKAQKRGRLGSGLRRAYCPTPGDTVIFTERFVVDFILDTDVVFKHFKVDGTEDIMSIPLVKWREQVRTALKKGAIFKPVK